MSDEDFEARMKRLCELKESLSRSIERLNADEALQSNPTTINLSNGAPKMSDQININELFLKMFAQQNEFQERLLNKLDEIIKELKK